MTLARIITSDEEDTAAEGQDVASGNGIKDAGGENEMEIVFLVSGASAGHYHNRTNR